MTVQKRNAEMVDLLRGDFQHRAEANFAWKSACSAYMALPGLRGFWPLGTFDSNGDAYDQSGHGHTLTYNGNPTYNTYDLAPYIDLDGTGDYLERADEADLDILGTEAYVAIPGITFGAWAWFDNAAAAVEMILSKSDGVAAANIAYNILRTAAGVAQVEISSGAAIETQAGAAVAASGWYQVVGRWDPSTDLSVFVNGVESAAGASAIAAIQNNAANFQAGGRDNGAGGSTSNMDGRISMAFLCAAHLPDATLFSLYEQTRRMFYV